MSNGLQELDRTGSDDPQQRIISSDPSVHSKSVKESEYRRFSWWFWTEEPQNIQNGHIDLTNNPNDCPTDSFTDTNGLSIQLHHGSSVFDNVSTQQQSTQEDPQGLWQTTFRRMSLVFQREDLYTPRANYENDEGNAISSREESRTKSSKKRHGEASIDTEDLSSLNEFDSVAASGWFDWLWPTNTASDSMHTNVSLDLLKQARAAIESHKQTIFYAFHSNLEEPYGELAVSNTKTAQTLVSFKPKRLPRLVNQAQENSLDVNYKNQQIPPVVKSPQSTSTVLSITSANASVSIASSVLAASITTIISQPQTLPSIDVNFREITLKTKARLIGEHVLYNSTSERHIYRAVNLPKRQKRTQRAVIVGVHGFLPFKMVKTLIDQPTGSSQTMVKAAEKTLKSWLDPTRPHQINTIALEGKGTVKSGVKHHYALLHNWMHLIEQCDVLLFVGNYQGSVIAVHLLAKLFEDNHLKHVPKIGLLSMLGLYCGPTAGVDTKIVIRAFTSQENAVMNEIFELTKPNSATSEALLESWKILLDNDVKITLCSLFGDQFIPLYLLLNLRILHPNIFRNISISEDNPRVLSCLINICLLLLNLGLSDHGVIVDLLRFCQQGSRSFGNSKLYTNQDLYMANIRLTLETTSLKRRRPAKVIVPVVEDLYRLPWKIRELMETLIHTKHIRNLSLIQELLFEYNSWEPVNKNWKELKYALEGLLHFLIQDFL